MDVCVCLGAEEELMVVHLKLRWYDGPNKTAVIHVTSDLQACEVLFAGEQRSDLGLPRAGRRVSSQMGTMRMT